MVRESHNITLAYSQMTADSCIGCYEFVNWEERRLLDF